MPLLIFLLLTAGFAAEFEDVDNYLPADSSVGAFAMTIPGPDIYYVGGGLNVGPTESAWLIRKSIDGGASWDNVDSYQLAAGKYAQVYGLAHDVLGNLYAFGTATDDSGVVHAVMRMSSDEGRSFRVVDDYRYPDPVMDYNRAYRVFVTSQGEVFSIIQVYDDFSKTRRALSVIRRSLDQGASWETVDVCENCAHHAFREDPFGNLYTLGLQYFQYEPFGLGRLQLRQAGPDATGWKDVDVMKDGTASFAMAFDFDSEGNAWIAGNMGKYPSAWRTGIIRKWSPSTGGVTVAEFNLTTDETVSMTPYDLRRDPTGRMFVVGYATFPDKKRHEWILESQGPSGSDWKFVRDTTGTYDLGGGNHGLCYDPYRAKMLSFGYELAPGNDWLWFVRREKWTTSES